MNWLGAHVSTAGGVQNAFANAENIGANCFQIFGASPRQWKVKMPDDETLKAFHKEKERAQLGPIFLHASYLVNLGTPDDELYEKSVANLTDHLRIAELLGAEGLVYHVGSYKNSTPEESNKRVVEGMLKTLKDTPGNAHLIMENSAGGGSKLGLTIEEIGALYKSAASDRIKVCIDTAHAFGAGLFETYSPEELDAFKKTAESHLGLKNISVLHVNDSMAPYNSKKDRHDNIGEGEIGIQAFKNLAQDKFFSNIPWLLEVPGFEKTGPDKKNMNIVKSL